MVKVLSADEAVARIHDGATLAMSGAGLAGFAEEVAVAIERSFLATGHPRGLTLVHATAIGIGDDRGVAHLGREGLLTKWIGGYTRSAPPIAALIRANLCQAYSLPQGVVSQLYREIGAHRPGLITHVGLGTFVDPRLGGGRMNEVTTQDYVKVIEIEGKEYLFYPSFPIDVAVIRGTTADELGNLTMDEEPVLLGQLPLAQAAQNTGGIVIAQAKYLARAGSLHPKHVKVPGILVDGVVLASAPQYHLQTAGGADDPALSGDLKSPMETAAVLPKGAKAVVARRAAMELVPDAIVNLGIGYPDALSALASEEGVADLLTLTTELGVIGGQLGADLFFGTSRNADVLLEQQVMFDWYDGGGLDIAFLGLAQADQHGNVNVSRFSGMDIGPGGFINITQATPTVVYCGSFTAGGLQVEIKDGRLRVVTEGKYKKFLKSVEQITFSGAEAGRRGQRVLYVTERAVFELREGRFTLIEIAPGIDLTRDVLAQMDFEPAMAEPLGQMPGDLFQESWGKLRSIMTAKTVTKPTADADPAIPKELTAAIRNGAGT
jgi:propionate CoA-transferase